MRKIILIIGLMVITASQVMLGQAQPIDEQQPLLVSAMTNDEQNRQYTLYQYINAKWQPLALAGFVRGSLSPDGGWIAYQRVPPFLQALIDEGQDFLYGSAWDITLVALDHGDLREVAIQPTTITLRDSGYSGGIKRSLPVWSPDGSAFAWTEQDYPAQNIARLVAYDLETATTRVLDAALPQVTLSSDGHPQQLAWGIEGIVVFTNDPSDYEVETLRFYQPDSAAVNVVRFEDELVWSPIAGPFSVAQPDGSSVVVVQADDALWYQVDPVSGKIGQVATQLEMVNTTAPDAALRLVWDIYAAADSPHWRLLAADETERLAFAELRQMGVDGRFTQFVIDPAGQTAAYLQEGMLYLWEDGNLSEIAPPPDMQMTHLYWGAVQWQAGATYDLESDTGDDGVG